MLTFVSGTIFYISRRFFIIILFIILEIRKYLNSLCFKRPGVTNFGIFSNPYNFKQSLGLKRVSKLVKLLCVNTICLWNFLTTTFILQRSNIHLPVGDARHDVVFTMIESWRISTISLNNLRKRRMIKLFSLCLGSSLRSFEKNRNFRKNRKFFQIQMLFSATFNNIVARFLKKYRPARLYRLAESIHWSRFLGSLKA